MFRKLIDVESEEIGHRVDIDLAIKRAWIVLLEPSDPKSAQVDEGVAIDGVFLLRSMAIKVKIGEPGQNLIQFGQIPDSLGGPDGEFVRVFCIKAKSSNPAPHIDTPICLEDHKISGLVAILFGRSLINPMSPQDLLHFGNEAVRPTPFLRIPFLIIHDSNRKRKHFSCQPLGFPE